MHKECQHTLLQKACFITAIGIHACSISTLLLITPPKPPSVLSFFILLAGYTYARTSILLWNTGSITVNTNIKRSNVFQKYIITTGQKGTKSLTLRSSGMVPFSRWNPRSTLRSHLVEEVLLEKPAGQVPILQGWNTCISWRTHSRKCSA